MPKSGMDLIDLVKNGYVKGELIIGPISMPTIELREGDVIAICSANSLGYGDVLDRDPNLVMEDLRMGKISEWAARNVYKVVFDPENAKK